MKTKTETNSNSETMVKTKTDSKTTASTGNITENEIVNQHENDIKPNMKTN